MNRKIILTAIAATLFLAGCSSLESNSSNQIAKFNCEQSGGLYESATCDCSKVDGEFGEYEKETGYCLTAVGSPGGELGEEAKKLHAMQSIIDGDLDVAVTQIGTTTTKKYRHKVYDFTFEFPSDYIYDKVKGLKGLWSSSSYEAKKNPLFDQMMIPHFVVETAELKGQTFEQYLAKRVSIDGDRYEEKIFNGKKVVFYSISEYMDDTFVYINHNDLVVIFRLDWCYDEVSKTHECNDITQILDTLQFEG